MYPPNRRLSDNSFRTCHYHVALCLIAGIQKALPIDRRDRRSIRLTVCDGLKESVLGRGRISPRPSIGAQKRGFLESKLTVCWGLTGYSKSQPCKPLPTNDLQTGGGGNRTQAQTRLRAQHAFFCAKRHSLDTQQRPKCTPRDVKRQEYPAQYPTQYPVDSCLVARSTG